MVALGLEFLEASELGSPARDGKVSGRPWSHWNLSGSVPQQLKAPWGREGGSTW